MISLHPPPLAQNTEIHWHVAVLGWGCLGYSKKGNSSLKKNGDFVFLSLNTSLALMASFFFFSYSPQVALDERMGLCEFHWLIIS